MENFSLPLPHGFSLRDTLLCGQCFRWEEQPDGSFTGWAGIHHATLRQQGDTLTVTGSDPDFWTEYLDLLEDYDRWKTAFAADRTLSVAVAKCGGIRILRQDAEETLFSFIVPQNNRIPRIRAVIGNICTALGTEHIFMGERYFSFPPAQALAEKDAKFYADCGAGYRAAYISETAKAVAKEGLGRLSSLRGKELRKELMRYKGVGAKVADCVALFGFSDTGAFPVDTWIEKVYREEFGGALKSRESISAYFCEKFGTYGGFIQQYLFYDRRERGE